MKQTVCFVLSVCLCALFLFVYLDECVFSSQVEKRRKRRSGRRQKKEQSKKPAARGGCMVCMKDTFYSKVGSASFI